ncbi:MAG TPA: hypothetical protein PKY96_08170, partial [Flavobacteriales bacterium]|nr:hypothetical protein [Flavobacteriales bacterium]
ILNLTLTTIGNGNCVAAIGNVAITFTPSPIVNAGVDGSVCANNAAINLNGAVSGATGAIWSGGAGSHAPNNTTLNAIYTPTVAERNAGSVTLTLTSAGNGSCNAVSDQVLWTITPAPTANAGPDQVLCSNNPMATLGGSVTVASGGTWSGGAGSFSPSANNLNATYTPTLAEIASGNLTLTLTTTGNGQCTAVSDQMVISFTPAPTVSAGADLSLCRNNAIIALNGSNGRHLERRRWLFHAEQHRAERELHADASGARSRHADLDLDHHGQRQLHGGERPGRVHLHPCTNSRRRPEPDCLREQFRDCPRRDHVRRRRRDLVGRYWHL